MKKAFKTLTIICPSCDESIRFSKRPRLGEIIVCYECEETLKVVSLSPLKVNWFFWNDNQNWSEAGVDDHADDIYTQHDHYNWD
jgi:lysine biosynthesis protein LysW